jgi:hypothetical protein
MSVYEYDGEVVGHTSKRTKCHSSDTHTHKTYLTRVTASSAHRILVRFLLHSFSFTSDTFLVIRDGNQLVETTEMMFILLFSQNSMVRIVYTLIHRRFCMPVRHVGCVLGLLMETASK